MTDFKGCTAHLTRYTKIVTTTRSKAMAKNTAWPSKPNITGKWQFNSIPQLVWKYSNRLHNIQACYTQDRGLVTCLPFWHSGVADLSQEWCIEKSSMFKVNTKIRVSRWRIRLAETASRFPECCYINLQNPWKEQCEPTWKQTVWSGSIDSVPGISVTQGLTQCAPRTVT